MLYLEDYLELIDHLPQELRDRFTLIRENDLQVNNSSLNIDTKVKQFFAEAEKLSPEQRQCEYESILKDYERTLEYANNKVELADQTHDTMVKLIQKLDSEIDKFKLELEADHGGISLGSNNGLKSTYKNHYNSADDQQHSALKAALSSRSTLTPQNINPSNGMMSPSIQNNKISTNNNAVREKGYDLIDPIRSYKILFYQRDETKYCICRQVSYGAMVACDNEECEIEWFHYDCVGITQPPKGQWYCHDCTRKMSSLDHHNTSSHQQTQTHRKRGRKEMIAN
jgi:succinate dehydrogenase flavin-adding protein (antitoxin of CptAB toxin-antitoxin module)